MKGIFWVLGCKLAFQQPLHKRKPIKWKQLQGQSAQQPQQQVSASLSFKLEFRAALRCA
jgi:hypothetical protein